MEGKRYPKFNAAIVVDTREQAPYQFDKMILAGLPAGDYSVQGYETKIAIERKSKADAYSSLGQQRDRFERELDKLRSYFFAAIVIETTLHDFLDPPPFSRLHPAAAINTLIAWSVRYRVHIAWASNRRLGNALTYRYLEKAWRELRAGGKK